MTTLHPDPGEREKARQARAFVEAVPGERPFVLETRKLGKWRRWLATVYPEGQDETLNALLIREGLAAPAAAAGGGAAVSNRICMRSWNGWPGNGTFLRFVDEKLE